MSKRDEKERREAQREQMRRLVEILPRLMRAGEVPQIILAEYLNVAQPTVSGWSRGRVMPHPSFYVPLAHFTKRLVDGLKTGELPLKNTRRRGEAYKAKLREYFGITEPGSALRKIALEEVEVKETEETKASVIVPAMHSTDAEPVPVLRDPDELQEFSEGDEGQAIDPLAETGEGDNEA